jgi:ABC-2 type transport system permease protein
MPTLVIAWKDFRSLVTSSVFLVCAAVASCLWSFVFLRQILEFAAKSMAGPMMGMNPEPMNIHFTVFMSHMGVTNVLLIFAVPAFTMRLLAEEKKNRTYDLLLTSPITATHIALGKFLAGFGATMVLLLISFLYPLGASMFADFSFAPLLTTYLGATLLAALYVAVGLFSSSMTDSVLLAVIVGIIFNLSLWFVTQGSEMASSPLVSQIMEQISIGQQYSTFLRGTLQISAIVFFLSAITLFVFLTQRVIESSRWR